MSQHVYHNAFFFASLIGAIYINGRRFPVFCQQYWTTITLTVMFVHDFLLL